MRKLLWLLYQPYKWLVYIPCLLLSTAILGSLALLLSILINPKIASNTCGVWWARLNSYLTPMLVRVQGRENINKDQSYVVVSNHQSYFDIFVLYGWLGIDFKWVIKKELRKVPFLGIACEKIGHIYIDRSNTQAAIASLQEAKKKLTRGTSVLFFPEGTRSITGELQPFKKGAFSMALELGIPILPVSVLNTANILPARTMNLFPGRATLMIHEPCDVTPYSAETMDMLMSEVKKAVQAGLDAGPD